MNQNKLYAIIGRLLSGEASASEKQQLRDWQNEKEENQKLFQKIKSIWEDTEINHLQVTEKPFQRVKDKIRISEKYYREPLPLNKKIKIRYIYRAAAILLFIISSYLLGTQQYFSTQEKPRVAEIIKENPPGQKSKVHLPDGSIVWLNAQSILKYPTSFGNVQRVVKLQGEAYFEVVKDSTRPFSVISDDITTTALGTSFNINAFHLDEEVQVTLVDGKVKVSSEQNEDQFLTPGQGLIYNKMDNELQIKNYQVENVIAWVNGVLRFEDDGFQTIIQKLERWYGVQIQVVGEPDNNLKYTAKFKNEYLSNVLESMSFGRPFSYEINDKIVTLKF